MAGLSHIAQEIADETGVSNRKTRQIVKEIIDFTNDEIVERGEAYYRGLGTFYVRDNKVFYKPCKSLKEYFKRESKARGK